MKTRIEKEIDGHYTQACDKASAFVEKQARIILRKHPHLHEFIMAMGSWFFTAKAKDADGHHIMIHATDYDAPRYIKSGRLAEFIADWDAYLKITGEPMRFTANGDVVRDW